MRNSCPARARGRRSQRRQAPQSRCRSRCRGRPPRGCPAGSRVSPGRAWSLWSPRSRSEALFSLRRRACRAPRCAPRSARRTAARSFAARRCRDRGRRGRSSVCRRGVGRAPCRSAGQERERRGSPLREDCRARQRSAPPSARRAPSAAEAAARARRDIREYRAPFPRRSCQAPLRPCRSASARRRNQKYVRRSAAPHRARSEMRSAQRRPPCRRARPCCKAAQKVPTPHR